MPVVRSTEHADSRNSSYVHAGPLQAGTKYYWQVVAVDSRGAEVAGPVWSFTTAAALSFDSPTFVDETSTRLPPDNEHAYAVNIVDLNADGAPDVFTINENPWPDEQTASLALNDGTGHFTPQVLSGLPVGKRGWGSSWVDYDRDGDQDVILWFCDGTPRLYRNEGGYRFTDVTQQAGISFITTPTINANTCSWADIDNDGDMDLYCSWEQRLFRNQGNGTFANASNDLGIPTSAGTADYPWASVWLDFDGDGDLDLATAGGGTEFPFFTNDGHGRFTADYIPLSTGGMRSVDHVSITAGDFNNDGLPDLYLGSDGSGFYANGNPAYTPDVLLKNRGDGTFENVIQQTHLPQHLTSGFAVTWADYDNDGFLDLAAGSRLFHNNGDMTFSEMGNAIGIYSYEYRINGVVAFDANRDGATDLYYGTGNKSQLFINLLSNPSRQKWIDVSLSGTKSDKAGFGAEIRVQAGNRLTYQWPATGIGSGEQESPIRRFGIQDAAKVDIRVRWPSGTVDEIFDIATNQKVTITEGANVDKTAPSTITNLVAMPGQEQGVVLGWTAPGDDALVRTAARYEFRYLNAPITDNNWTIAQPLADLPQPAAPEFRQFLEAGNLLPDTLYYFAMKTYDEAGNVSGLSNVAEVRTPLGTRILGLVALPFGPERIDLNWKVPEVLVNTYEIRYSTNPIYPGNFASATAVVHPPDPGYPGELQQVSIAGLSSGTTYYFAIKMIPSDNTELPLSSVVSARTTLPVDNSLTQIANIWPPNNAAPIHYRPYSSGDFNGDGAPDLAIAYWSSSFYWALPTIQTTMSLSSPVKRLKCALIPHLQQWCQTCRPQVNMWAR